MAFGDLLPAILIFAYIGLLAAVIAVWGRMRERTMEEYAVAGRSFPWWTIIFTVLATWIVASIYTGWFGWAGTGGAIAFYAVVYSTAGLVIYYLIAPRVWKWGKLHDLYNMPDFIRLRYNSPGLAVLITVMAIVIGAPWQVMSIKTFGFLMHEATNGTVPFNVGMGIITLTVLGYTVYAGMRSVVITDFIQGVLSTVIMLVALVWIATSLFGGFGPLLDRVATQNPDMMVVNAQSGYWASIILTGTIGGYAWLEIFNRIFLARDVKEVKRVAVGAPIIMVVALFFLMTLAMGGSLIPEVAEAGQSAFFRMGRIVGGPLLLAGIGIIVLAAGMSSLDSQITTLGVVTSWNIIKELKPDIETGRAVNISRAVIVVWITAAFGLATLELPLLAKIGVMTYEGIVHLFPPIALGLFWRKGNKYGAVAGMAVGLAVTYGINIFYASSFGGPAIAGWTGALIGFPINVGIFVAAAYLGPEVDYVDDLFEEVHEFDGETADVRSREAVLDKYDPMTTDD